jgi:hypothetical protein
MLDAFREHVNIRNIDYHQVNKHRADDNTRRDDCTVAGDKI